MVERQQRNVRKELEESLEINKADLDSCLVEQPGYFYHVAEEVAAANAQRDTAKLELEETIAEEDGKFRSLLARNEEKATESSIQNYLRTLDNVKELQRAYLEARTQAEQWTALKEAYQQRSFMLRELVALSLAQFHNLGIERGAVSARHSLAEVNEKRAGELRRESRTPR